MHAARRAKVTKINVVEEVEAPRMVRVRPKALNEADACKLVQSLEGNWKHPIVVLALTTGLRRGEVCGLRWKDIDLNNGTLRVAGQLVQYEDNSIAWSPPKTESGARTISLSADTVELLTKLYRQTIETRLRLGRGRDGLEDAYVFTHRNDCETPIKPRNLGESFRWHCNHHGLPEFSFHGIRHTHITELLKHVGKEGAKAVSQRAGHADINVTLSVYQTVFESDDRKLAELSSGLVKKK
jgi:integrase